MMELNKVRKGGYWDNNNPCVVCTDNECREYINYICEGNSSELREVILSRAHMP